MVKKMVKEACGWAKSARAVAAESAVAAELVVAAANEMARERRAAPLHFSFSQVETKFPVVLFPVVFLTFRNPLSKAPPPPHSPLIRAFLSLPI
jgi:hypothetical protein